MKKLNILFIILLFSICLKAQTTLTLQPNASTGKDALISSLYSTSNFGNSTDFAGIATTVGGNLAIGRSLIDFDLSSIPSTAVITGATLYLYSFTSSSNGSNTGDNTSYLQMITSSWDEMTVTWNTAPTTTNLHQGTLQASTSSNQIYIVNVTNLVQDYVSDQANSFGFMLCLADESAYKGLIFASSDNADSTLHPKLIVTYTTSPIPSDTCITMQPDNKKGKDALISSLYSNVNFGNDLDFAGIATTVGGNFAIGRSLIDFDLSFIPSNAVISSATLSLYSFISPDNGGNLGSNTSYLQRITSSWNDMTVTWNTAPSTTTLHQVTLPASMSSNQIYGVDIKTLVQDYVADQANSFGFMLRLADETIYKGLIFASSDDIDSTLHPKLEVCYSIPNGVNEQQLTNNYVSVYPNPATKEITVSTTYSNALLSITDLSGKVFISKRLNATETKLNIDKLCAGVYMVILHTAEGNKTTRLVVE